MPHAARVAFAHPVYCVPPNSPTRPRVLTSAIENIGDYVKEVSQSKQYCPLKCHPTYFRPIPAQIAGQQLSGVSSVMGPCIGATSRSV
jgi:hypothetical protein